MSRSVWISCTIAAAFCWLFAAEITGYFDSASSPIAFLATSRGTVRRLPKDRYLWERIRDGSRLSLWDTIATASDTGALLTFFSGEQLDLAPSSMVTLEPKQENLELVFLNGSGQFRAEKGALARHRVVVRAQESPISKVVRAPDLIPYLEMDPNGALSRNMLSTLGQVISVPELPPIPEILEPEDHTVVDFNRQTELRVALKFEPNVSYEIELWPDREKAKPWVFHSAIEALSVDDLPEGNYFWSARTVSAGGKHSQPTLSRQLTVVAHSTLRHPAIYSPVIRYHQKNPSR